MLLMTALASSCGAAGEPASVMDITEASASQEENLVVNNPAARSALKNNPEGAAYDEPFTSYTYDFSVYEDNYMITAAPDETRTGLVLTVENNRFGYSKFNVTPPEKYMVCLPYSQEFASQVCTVIKGSSDGDTPVPDLLKIDFCLADASDESMPYTVSRMYSISNDSLVEVELYNTEPDAGAGTEPEGSVLEPMSYIPESVLYRTESLKFMPEPTVTVGEDGSLSAEIITYTLNPNDMTMRCAREDCSSENPLYFGYAAHAIAGSIYQYFIATSLNVSDYENYVEVPSPDNENSQYFFKVDDPRFSTVTELRDYVSGYFDEKLVNKMFIKAPQQYRDINGSLYTILGDGGINEELGQLMITSWRIDGNVITYHTKQEKFNSEQVFDGYIDGGDFVVELTSGGSGFIVKEYRYPTES